MIWNYLILIAIAHLTFASVDIRAHVDDIADKLNTLEKQIIGGIQDEIDTLETWAEPWFEDIGDWFNGEKEEGVAGLPPNMNEHPNGFWFGTQDLMCVFHNEIEIKWEQKKETLLDDLNLPDSVIDELRKIPGVTEFKETFFNGLRDIIELDWDDADKFADDLKKQIGQFSDSLSEIFHMEIYGELQDIQKDLTSFWNKTEHIITGQSEQLFNDIREEASQLSKDIANVSMQILQDGQQLPESILEDITDFRADVAEFFDNNDLSEFLNSPSSYTILEDISEISDHIWNTTVHLQNKTKISELIFNDLQDIQIDLSGLVNASNLPSFEDLSELSESIFDSDLISIDISDLSNKISNITNNWFGSRVRRSVPSKALARYNLETVHRMLAYKGMVYEWGVAGSAWSISTSPYYPDCQTTWEEEPAGTSYCESQNLVTFTESYSMTYGNYELLTNNCHHYANRIVALLTSSECGLSYGNSPATEDNWWDKLNGNLFDNDSSEEEHGDDEVPIIQ